jgi:BirA family biotin operon repressor/biotin-[acetyl-CoA-carboxylase] ligase
MRRIHFDVIDSTNVQARRLAGEHPGERLLVTATEQTAGRGRQGRSWASPRGGAWLSVVWPIARPIPHLAGASLAAAVAVRRGVARAAPDAAERLTIKWPNDLLLDDHKVAGILCESFAAASGAEGRPALMVVGVGVNANFDAGLLPDKLRYPATTLPAALGQPVEVEAVIAAIADELETALVEFETAGLGGGLLDDLAAHLAYRGAERTLSGPQGAVTGRIVGVDESGRLVLETSSGRVAFDTGELVPPDARNVAT